MPQTQTTAYEGMLVGTPSSWFNETPDNADTTQWRTALKKFQPPKKKNPPKPFVCSYCFCNRKLRNNVPAHPFHVQHPSHNVRANCEKKQTPTKGLLHNIEATQMAQPTGTAKPDIRHIVWHYYLETVSESYCLRIKTLWVESCEYMSTSVWLYAVCVSWGWGVVGGNNAGYDGEGWK